LLVDLRSTCRGEKERGLPVPQTGSLALRQGTLSPAPLLYEGISGFEQLQFLSLGESSGVQNNVAHAVTEDGEALILRLPLLPAGIDLLDDDGQLEMGEGHVEVHGGEVTAALLRVYLHELCTVDEAWQRRHRWQH